MSGTIGTGVRKPCYISIYRIVNLFVSQLSGNERPSNVSQKCTQSRPYHRISYLLAIVNVKIYKCILGCVLSRHNGVLIPK